MTKKTLALILISVIVVLLGSALALRFMIPSNDWVRQNIETTIADATKTKVSIGNISIGFSFPNPVKVSAEDVRTLGSDGSETLTARIIEITPSVSELLKGVISASSIKMDGIRARVVLRDDGLLEYPFLPPPVSSPPDIRENVNVGAGVSQEPPEKSQKSRTPGSRESNIAWSIKAVSINNLTLELVDLRSASRQPLHETINVSHIDLKQTESGNKFGFLVKGVSIGSSTESMMKLNGSGQVQLSPSLDTFEKCQVALKSDHADLSVISSFLPQYESVLQPLRIYNSDLDLEYDSSAGASLKVDGLVAHNSNISAPLKVKARVQLPQNLDSVKHLEIFGEALQTPVAMFSPIIDISSIDLSSSLFSGKFSFEGNPYGDWSGNATVQFHGAGLDKSYGFQFDGSVISMSCQGGPQFLELKELKLADKSSHVTLSGTMSRPLTNQTNIDLRLESQLTFSEQAFSKLAGSDAVSLNGPAVLTGRLKGPINKLGFDVQTDLAQASVDVAKTISKRPSSRGTLWAKGVASNLMNNRGASCSIDATCGFDFPKTLLTSTDGSVALKDIELTGKSSINYGPKGLDFKDMDVELRRHGGRTFLAKLRGNVDGLIKGPMKLNATLNSNFDRDLMNTLGLSNSKDLIFLGHTTIGAKVNQSGTSYVFAVDAPLKNLEISYDDSFLKKQGIDGSLNVSGSYTARSTKIQSATLTLPGVSVATTGSIANHENEVTEMDLNIKELDLKKLSTMLPNLASEGMAGRCSGRFSLKYEKNRLLPYGSIQFDSVTYRPQKSMVYFEQMNGSARINAFNIEKISIDGKARGFVEAPLTCSGNLHNIHSIDNLKGNLSLKLGNGAIKFQNFRGAVSKTQSVLGALGGALLNNPNISSPEFSSISGDFAIDKGIAQTDNLLQVGGDLKSAIIGTIDLRNRNLNAVLGAKALVTPLEQLGKIPAVKELVKKHEGLLKITGLDKELKKFGIDAQDQQPANPEQARTAKTQMFVVFKLTGNAGEPNVTPVLERSVGENTASRLKALVE